MPRTTPATRDATAVLPADATVDLHLHTRASDGLWTPETLVDRAAALGLRAIAVADHDAIDSVEPVARLATRRGIAVITGVELSVRWDGRQWHLLVYGADLREPTFRQLVDEQRRRHIEAAERAIAALQAGGYAVPALAEAVGGRPPLPIYVMEALVRDGFADSILGANQFVTNRLGIPFYIDVPIERAVAAAHVGGGQAVLAHPGRYDPAPLTADDLARLLTTAPLDGLEVYYPTHTPEQVTFYAGLAGRHRLLHSAGSDSHGPGRPRDPLAYPAARVAPLLARCGIRAVGAN